MAYMTEKEREDWMKKLKELNHTIDLAHLKSIIREIGENKVDNVDLRNSPLHKHSPAQVCDLLEELGWSHDDWETNGWDQDTWIPFTHENYSFGITLNYSGYYWTMKLYRIELEEA